MLNHLVKGRRVGFGLYTLDGREGILAHVGLESPYRVGKYGVNLRHIEKIAVPAVPSRSLPPNGSRTSGSVSMARILVGRHV